MKSNLTGKKIHTMPKSTKKWRILTEYQLNKFQAFPFKKFAPSLDQKKEDFGHVSLKQILSPPMKHSQDV